MKKLVLTLLFAAGISTAFSQTVNFGIKAGLNLSELVYKNSNELGNSFLTGFNAGGIVDIGFPIFLYSLVFFIPQRAKKTLSSLQVLPWKMLVTCHQQPG